MNKSAMVLVLFAIVLALLAAGICAADPGNGNGNAYGLGNGNAYGWPEGNDQHTDSDRPHQIPEPAVLALLGFGLFGLSVALKLFLRDRVSAGRPDK